MFGKTLDKYKSNLEKTYILLQKDKREHVLFWACSNKDKKAEVLSFENFYGNEEAGKQFVAWLKGQELLGIPISRSLHNIEAETQALENAAFGPAPKQRTKT
jgi:hypothetical protein